MSLRTDSGFVVEWMYEKVYFIIAFLRSSGLLQSL